MPWWECCFWIHRWQHAIMKFGVVQREAVETEMTPKACLRLIIRTRRPTVWLPTACQSLTFLQADFFGAHNLLQLQVVASWRKHDSSRSLTARKRQSKWKTLKKLRLHWSIDLTLPTWLAAFPSHFHNGWPGPDLKWKGPGFEATTRSERIAGTISAWLPVWENLNLVILTTR